MSLRLGVLSVCGVPSPLGLLWVFLFQDPLVWLGFIKSFMIQSGHVIALDYTNAKY
uniref:Uncharacterized protein n=1 Tax=Nelumbo nucifera TaxID=4432 RepID=A0A822ZLV6_NELNU|nr:TPA_asm: hypothetical protein HUJ06_004107 [Nelumbo nucifera]